MINRKNKKQFDYVSIEILRWFGRNSKQNVNRGMEQVTYKQAFVSKAFDDWVMNTRAIRSPLIKLLFAVAND